MKDVTRILQAIQQGEPQAAAELLPAIYSELRGAAGRLLNGEMGGHTLQTTELVHEAYLRLVDTENPQLWNSRGHFFKAAAEAMRRILIEHARRKKSLKRGGDRVKVDIELGTLQQTQTDEQLLALDEALTHFAQQDPRAAQLVELRFFAGLTLPEAAETLDISLRTAERDWTFARAWLHKELQEVSTLDP